MEVPNATPQYGAQPPQQPRKPQRRKQRFRWWWITVPLACFAVAYLLSTAIPPRFDWRDIMTALGVPTYCFNRYTRLAILSLVLICITLMLRILRGGKT